MKLGLQLPWFTYAEGPAVISDKFRAQAIRAEQAGFASLWVMDHFFQIPPMGAPENDMLEAYTALGFAAAVTERIKLGVMVCGATYRHPGLLVKTATTLDVLSKGRSYFGIGAGWFEDEHRGLGVPFPSTSERFERLEETLQIAHRMFSGDQSPFHGHHYQLERPLNMPQPLSKPHPPILIGGVGEKKTLKLVAKYADACNIFYQDEAFFRGKLEVLRQHCENEKRDFNAIEKTAFGMFRISKNGGPSTTMPNGMVSHDFTVDQALETFAGAAAAGADHMLLGDMRSSLDYDLMATEVIPKLRPLATNRT